MDGDNENQSENLENEGVIQNNDDESDIENNIQGNITDNIEDDDEVNITDVLKFKHQDLLKKKAMNRVIIQKIKKKIKKY